MPLPCAHRSQVRPITQASHRAPTETVRAQKMDDHGDNIVEHNHHREGNRCHGFSLALIDGSQESIVDHGQTDISLVTAKAHMDEGGQRTRRQPHEPPHQTGYGHEDQGREEYRGRRVTRRDTGQLGCPNFQNQETGKADPVAAAIDKPCRRCIEEAETGKCDANQNDDEYGSQRV